MGSAWAAWLSGRTVRKHTMDVLQRENTAEHTWGVMLLLEKYVPYAHPRLLKFALIHDSGEKGTCDIPAHLCWAHPQIKDLVQSLETEHVLSVMEGPHPRSVHQHDMQLDELYAIEMADRAEFVLSCLYESRMGNTLALGPLNSALSKMAEALTQVPEASPLHGGLNQMFIDITREVKGSD